MCNYGQRVVELEDAGFDVLCFQGGLSATKVSQDGVVQRNDDAKR